MTLLHFEFVKAELVNGDNVIEGAIGAANPEFTYGYVKAASITVNAETAVTADGAVMKLTFKSLTGEKGSFQLSNGYNTKLGFNTSLLVDSVSNVGNKSVQYEGDDLKISQAEVVITVLILLPKQLNQLLLQTQQPLLLLRLPQTHLLL